MQHSSSQPLSWNDDEFYAWVKDMALADKDSREKETHIDYANNIPGATCSLLQVCIVEYKDNI